MNILKKMMATAAAVGGVFLNLALVAAFTKMLDATLGPPWTYVIHFLLGLFLAALVLLVKHAAAYVRMENKPKDPRAIARWELIRRLTAGHLIRYASWELDQLRSFNTGWRKRLRDFGALPAAIACSLISAPIVAALCMRLMGVPEFRAWVYVGISGAITTLTMVTGSLGIINALFSGCGS